MYDHNRHLIGVISQIKEEGASDELVHMLCVELKFAIVNSVNCSGCPMYIKRNAKNYLMLYTTHDDLMNHFPDWSHSHYKFRWFLENLNCPVYFTIDEKSNKISPCEDFETADGIVFRTGEDEFIVEDKLLDKINDYFKVDIYTLNEMKSMFESIDNERLEDLLSQSPQDWDEIIKEMQKSTMLFMLDVSDRSDYEEVDLIFDFLRFDTFGHGKEISLSTTKDLQGYQYAVIVNIKKAFDHILNFGLEGLTIHTSKEDAYMSRNLIIEKYELIEKCCDDKRLKHSHECIFKI
jgi:hypothetical protein